MNIQQRIAGLPEWPLTQGEVDWYDGLRVAEAALARLALAREWVSLSPHYIQCDSWRQAAKPCTCGRDALLAALEVPRG